MSPSFSNILIRDPDRDRSRVVQAASRGSGRTPAIAFADLPPVGAPAVRTTYDKPKNGKAFPKEAMPSRVPGGRSGGGFVYSSVGPRSGVSRRSTVRARGPAWSSRTTISFVPGRRTGAGT